MDRGFFITGTDTDVGKTTVALGIMAAFQQKGFTVAAMKPVSAGCVQTNEGLRNDDAVQLMQQASIELPYDIVNPYAFEPAIAPHIAAEEVNVEMDIDIIVDAYKVIAEKVDVVIVEGAGGWLVPFNKLKTMADIASVLQLDVIQVVGLRLGCLNHALLTAESINTHGLTSIGWIANHLTSSMFNATENNDALKLRIGSTCLGEIPHIKNIQTEHISQHIHINLLID